MSLAHLPTLLLLIGYPVFWLELYFIKTPYGRTSPLALILFLAVGIFVVFKNKENIVDLFYFIKQEYQKQSGGTKFFLAAGAAISFFIFLCGLYAALLPPHLLQEWDSLHYHMSLPRQHLIGNSFAHIPWAADDLFPFPLEFAMAPFWFVSELPNKLPQFLFFCGLVGVSANLVRRQTQNNFLKTALIVFAVFGSHFIGIQMGTAMFDLVICYLFLAAIDSFLGGAIWLGIIELAFFFWSKSFIPLQMGGIVIAGILLIFVMRRFHCQFTLFPQENRPVIFDQNTRRILAKAAVYFILVSLVVGLPFLLKSLNYAATPLYPFKPGIMPVYGLSKQPLNLEPLVKASEIWMTTVKDQYGYGYSVSAFLKHLWLIAVPEDGVNNKYDYPVGLIYLLFIGPFLYGTIRSLLKKQCNIIPLFIISFWGTWWMGSHQSRFLYIPVMIMVITVLSDSRINVKSSVLMVAVMAALAFNFLSVFRANKNDFGLPFQQVLRPQDKEVRQLSQEYRRANRKDIVFLDSRNILYAQFPVAVTERKLPHTLGVSK